MIALDTNVVVRVLVQDDERQTRRARALIDRALADGASLFVSTIVICETVWVLRSSYGMRRAAIVEAMRWLLAAAQVEVEHRAEVEFALAAFAGGKGGIADFLIRERARSVGAVAVATFDGALLKSDGFVDPDPSTWSDDMSLHEARPRYGRRRSAVTPIRIGAAAASGSPEATAR